MVVKRGGNYNFQITMKMKFVIGLFNPKTMKNQWVLKSRLNWAIVNKVIIFYYGLNKIGGICKRNVEPI